ncbi:MAG: DUF2920 family protein [Pirellulales bacterium]
MPTACGADSEPSSEQLKLSELWPTLPEVDATVQIPAQQSPHLPGVRTVKVYLSFPGGKLGNVNQETGLMLSLHNWGGTEATGTADPKFLANHYNVIAICVDYLQSGDRDHSVPYDCGYLQALDSLRALYFVYDRLHKLDKLFDDGRIYATGGSGGGNVSLMANKLAPRTFACLIDCSGRCKLTDDIAFGLPGGSRLSARYSQDSTSHHYLTTDAQEIRFVGHPEHLLTMKSLGNTCKVIISHGSTDHVCPVELAREMVANMQKLEVDVEAHFILDSDIDDKIFTNTGHGVGNRTLIVDHFARKYLLPDSPLAVVRKGKCDFEWADEKVRYVTANGEYVISYRHGYPVGRFETARDVVETP